jgi:hypothetical protein
MTADRCFAQTAALVWAAGVGTKVITKRLAVSTLRRIAAVCCTSHRLGPSWLPESNVTCG